MSINNNNNLSALNLERLSYIKLNLPNILLDYDKIAIFK